MRNNIKVLRKLANKTQQEVANDLGIKVERYRSWEQGKRSPTGQSCIMLAEYFNVTTDTILGTEYSEIHSMTLSPEEHSLIELFRLLSHADQSIVMRIAQCIANSY